MEKSEVSLEDQVKLYEAACGPLTDSYPWNFASEYKSQTPGIHWVNLRLSTDGTFSCDYFMASTSCNNPYNCFIWQGRGNFSYNSKERKLTLQADTLEIGNGHWKEDKYNPEILRCRDTFSKVESANFIWGTREIPSFPCYVVNPIDDENHDFLHPVESTLTWKADPNAILFKSKIDFIENFATLTLSEATTLSQPVNFGDLTLNPDNTLSIYTREYSWDRDGPYNWDSSFSCKGTWEYSLAAREITLRFHSFKINNDNKPLSEEEVNKFNFPTEIKTQHFYLEGSSLIECFESKWNYSDCAGFGTVHWTRK